AKPTDATTWTRMDSTGDLLRFRASFPWDLAALKDAKLQPGDVLEYFALVQDNFALNGATHAPVPSGRLRISIISQEIAEVKSSQTRTQRETAGLARDTKDKPNFDPADKVAADRLVNQQSTAASQAKQLSGKLDEIGQQLAENKSPNQELKDTARDVGDPLNKTAEGPMKDAAGQVNSAKQTSSKDDRNQQMQQAQAN